jgi:hypothetical protein
MNTTLLLSRWGRALGKTLMKSREKFKPEINIHKWNIVKGDLVQVIQGPQTGQRGKVLTVIRNANRIIIEGVNLVSLQLRHYLLFQPHF